MTNRRGRAGRFAPKPNTDWLSALSADELEVLLQQMSIVVRFKDVDPSTEDEAGDYLAACYLVHWLACVGRQRQGHPACPCDTCTQVDAAFDADVAERTQAQAERELALEAGRMACRQHREDEQERLAQVKVRRRRQPIVEPPALLAEPLDPNEMIQVISAHGLITVRRGDLEDL